MAGVEESGNEASGEHGSDSVTSFWNIKTCTFQKQYQPNFGNELYDKRFTRIAFKKARSGSFSILYYYHTILEIYTFFKTNKLVC